MTSKRPLTELRENPDNPRTITPDNLERLVNSIIEFPKMLEIRPVLAGADGLIVGGNMRFRALNAILGMNPDELFARIAVRATRRGMTAPEIEALRSFWAEWRHEPFAYVTDTDRLSADDIRSLIIKDNVNAGYFDYDLLENFDKNDLDDWGVVSWGGMNPLVGTKAPAQAPAPQNDHGRLVFVFPRERNGEAREMLGLEGTKTAYTAREIINAE